MQQNTEWSRVFNKEWLKQISPANIFTHESNEWVRNHFLDAAWRTNYWWFYKSNRLVIHIVVAIFESSGNVMFRDFRWDNGKREWVATKPPIKTTRLEFYKHYWYANRCYKDYGASDSYNCLCKTMTEDEYAAEMALKIVYRIQEYSNILLELSKDKGILVKQFVHDLVGDFGYFEVIATICRLSELLYNCRDCQNRQEGTKQAVEKGYTSLHDPFLKLDPFRKWSINTDTLTRTDIELIYQILRIIVQ